MLTYFLPLLICLCKFSYASAASDSLSAYVSADTVKLNQPFEIGIKGPHNNYTIEKSSIYSFNFIGGPNTTMNMSTVNGLTTTIASKALRVLATKPGDYSISVKILNRDSIELYYTKVVVIDEPWTEADEEASKKNTSGMNLFNDPFFDTPFKNQETPSASTQPSSKPSAKNKAKPAKLTGFQSQFETYNATLQKEAVIRYIITFDKMDAGYYSIGNISIIEKPSAGNVYIQVNGQGKISNGNEGNGGYSKYIEFTARCTNKGKYVLSPLVISYNGKKHKSKKVVLIIGSSSTEI